MECYINVLKNYCNFNGRASRKEYWMFVLFQFIISAIFYVLVISTESLLILALLYIYSLGTALPGLAVTVRRLHDINKSWTYILFGLIPCIGPFALMYFYLQAGDDEANNFGEPPTL